MTADRAAPAWWVLARHEWRLAMRDFAAFGARRRSRSTKKDRPAGVARRVVAPILLFVVLHAAGGMALAFPRRWHDDVVGRFAAVLVLSFLFTFMLSYTMSRIVTAFHERRDLDFLLAAPIDPGTILAVRTATIVVVTTATFAFFVYPLADVGVVLGRTWLARLYLLVPLVATIATAVALVLTDSVVRAVGVRRARVGLQIFSALVGASMYFVSQARQFLPVEATVRMGDWIRSIVRVDDAPAPIAFVAALARGDWSAWIGLVVAAVALFAAATLRARRRFVEIAQTPETAAQRPPQSRVQIDRRFAKGFEGGAFATLLSKEWRLILRAPQLLSQVLLQILYLTPLLFVAMRRGGSGLEWAPAAFAGGIVGVASTLASALAWLTVAAEDAPHLLAGSPHRRGVILAAKLVAAAAPPIGVIAIAAAGTVQRSVSQAAIVLVFGTLSCASAAILAAASPAVGKRTDFQRRYQGRGVSAVVEVLQFLLWTAAAGSAGAGWWLAAAGLTAGALVAPAVRLPRAMSRFGATD